MSSILDTAKPRIAARRGQIVDLNVDFLHNGILTDPYAIRRIEIYKTQVLPHNLIATIPLVLPTNNLYPAPVVQDYKITPDGECCTEPTAPTIPVVGKYHLPYSVPVDSLAPDIYYDVWYWFTANPCGEEGTDNPTGCDIDDSIYDALLLKCCHRFWVYPDDWYCNDKLQTIRFGFEPLDQKFYSPETRPLEVGLMPLPLYTFNAALVNPMIPFLVPTITIQTQHNEILAQDAMCRMGVRQGSYRSNPFVIQHDLDTTKYLKGTYSYNIKLTLPDGSTRVSPKYIFSIY